VVFFYGYLEKQKPSYILMIFSVLYLVLAYFISIVVVSKDKIVIKFILNPFSRPTVIPLESIKSMHIVKVTSRNSRDCLRFFLLPDAEEKRAYTKMTKTELRKLYDYCLLVGIKNRSVLGYPEQSSLPFPAK